MTIVVSHSVIQVVCRSCHLVIHVIFCSCHLSFVGVLNPMMVIHHSVVHLIRCCVASCRQQHGMLMYRLFVVVECWSDGDE
jgi:hypothetical protein